LGRETEKTLLITIGKGGWAIMGKGPEKGKRKEKMRRTKLSGKLKRSSDYALLGKRGA